MENTTQAVPGNSTPLPTGEWFEQWFDSPYYHLLYRDRDEREAEGFIDRLLARLQLSSGARVLDLACGKGRYSRHLAGKGLEVTGIDLSVRSIEYARQFEQENLSFFTHDMRLPFRTNYFDAIFNFFTSFGYFDTEREELKTLKNVAVGLKPEAVFVLDFFNADYVINRLTGPESKEIDGIIFNLFKSVESDRVEKSIRFSDQGRNFFYHERVRLFRLADFERLFASAGLQLLQTFGDYQLNPFQQEQSPRLILIARKND